MPKKSLIDFYNKFMIIITADFINTSVKKKKILQSTFFVSWDTIDIASVGLEIKI